MRSILITIAILFVAEGGARLWTAYEGNPVDKVLEILEPNPTYGWRVRPNLDTPFLGSRIQTDGDGFRLDSDRIPNPPAIWMYGPSSAFGWGVEARETYINIAARALGIGEKNVSQIGYASSQGLMLLKHLPPPAHSVAVFAYGINDLDRFRFFFPTPETDSDFFAREISAVQISAMNTAAKLHSLRYFARAATKLKLKFFCRIPPAAPLRVPSKAFKKNVLSFAAQVRARGSQIVLIDTPYREKSFGENTPPSESDAAYRAAYEAGLRGDCRTEGQMFQRFLQLEPARIAAGVRQLNRDLENLAKTNSIPLVKASELLTNPSDFLDPVHPSPAGHKKIADALVKILAKAHLPMR